jgi:hypothetical protein
MIGPPRENRAEGAQQRLDQHLALLALVGGTDFFFPYICGSSANVALRLLLCSPLALLFLLDTQYVGPLSMGQGD